MEALNYLVIQSTNTSEAKDLSKQDVIKHHTTPTSLGGLGFNRPGFDYLILQDGTLETLVNEHSPTDVDLWGISGGKYPILGNVKHIGYVGGRTLKEAFWKDTRTEEQEKTLEAVVRFYTLRFPKIIVVGFDDPTRIEESKNPAFDVQKWLVSHGISAQNQYQKIPLTRTV
ncbi:N-acetylmuramoyl-L-alanine amidase [uncultured Dokdonia sp.]|uniref:N-acetylmuramoyl-L-alanine amidase n=1 Tax=uncultured Dokdonia sp. TaxID=575653 RepID=UPI002618B4B6|nr:N-acetylmuramoyl-L-alanine amidase [uncultured Dokdonia sp.]